MDACPTRSPRPCSRSPCPTCPTPRSSPGGLSYEPKWDGFRALVSWDGENVEIGSRGAKPLTRYFPELVEAFARLLPEPCLLDGEVVVPKGEPGAQRLDWESLTQRIHPAASRVNMLAEKTPAMFIAFDLLARGDRDLQPEPFAVRRAQLVELLAGAAASHPRHAHDDGPRRSRGAGSREFEGAGLDGVVAKPLAQPYAPNKRTMFKIKHARTADVVALGYRIHKSGEGVGSLLVGLYSDDGTLYPVGGVAAWSNAAPPRAHRRARTARRARR